MGSNRRWEPKPSGARQSRPLPIVSSGLIILGLAWLGFKFFTQPLGIQDQVSSVVSMLLGVAGLFVDRIKSRRDANHGREGVSGFDPVDRDKIARNKVRELAARHVGLPRIGDEPADPINLRIHAALPLQGQQPDNVGAENLLRSWVRNHILGRPQGVDPYLPTYVERDIQPQLDAWADEAIRTGGFLTLVGDSAVGKTRLLYELALRKFARMYVVAPNLGDASVINALGEADFTLPPVLIWLDELHRFLPGRYLPEGGTALQASALERLLKAPTPVVFLGAYWPGHSQYFRALSRGSLIEPEPQNPVAYQIVSNPRLLEVRLDSFSQQERRRAAVLAAQDSRLADAIVDQDYNVTETLAGAPRIMGLYRGATLAGRALLPALIDARRIGYQTGFTRQTLEEAARGYVRPELLAANWFEEPFRAVVQVDRGASALVRMREIEVEAEPRYTVSDYLLQRASRERRSNWPAESVWQTAINETSEIQGLDRIRNSAESRYLFSIARDTIQKLANLGDRPAQLVVIDELFEHRDEQGLREWADRNDLYAVKRLVAILIELDNTDDARDYVEKLVDGGDEAYFDEYLAILEGDLDIGKMLELLNRREIHPGRKNARPLSNTELRRVAESIERMIESSGDTTALSSGYLEAATESIGQVLALEPESSVSVPDAHRRDLIGKDNAELRAMAEFGDQLAAELLLDRLAEQDEAAYAAQLVAWADLEMIHAVEQLVVYYSERGMVDELRKRAELGDHHARGALDDILYDAHDIDGLLRRAQSGDHMAKTYLRYARGSDSGADHQHDDIDRLRELALEMHGEEILPAFDYLKSKKDSEALYLLAFERSIANCSRLLRERNDEIGLQKLVSASDSSAACELATLYMDSGRTGNALEVLASQIDDSDDYAAVDFATKILIDNYFTSDETSKCLDSLRARADAGDFGCGTALVKILREWGDLDTLQLELAAGNSAAGRAWADLLDEAGRVDESDALRRNGLTARGRILRHV